MRPHTTAPLDGSLRWGSVHPSRARGCLCWPRIAPGTAPAGTAVREGRAILVPVGFWLRFRAGPVGYTTWGRRGPQSYRAYKEARERRAEYAARYEREHRRETIRRHYALSRSERLGVAASILVVVVLSPIIAVAYLIRWLRRVVGPSTASGEASGATAQSERGSPGQSDAEDDALLRIAAELGVDLSPSALAAAVERPLVPDADDVQRQPTSADPGSEREPTVNAASRPQGWTIRGSTTSEFDGVTLPTLRAWLRFWEDERRSAGRAEEMARENPDLYTGRTRLDHIRMIKNEIAAREAEPAQ
jgi:hypothetical protein